MIAPLVLVLAGVPTSTAAPRVEPVIGVAGQLGFRRMAVVVDGDRHAQMRPIGVPLELELGAQLWYRKGDRFGSNGWRGVFSATTGPLLPTGGWPLSLLHMSLRELGRRPRLRFATGVGVQVAVDLPHAHWPWLAVGVPLVLATRRVDVWLMPSITAPLAVDRFAFFGGHGWRGVAPMVMPVVAGVRFKLGRA
ncbi:MAG: hypothetical protein K1X88_07615 [Nannocystaceae bacterium]|nr:hypothetical protein [Nannocystaceae bacterium]